MLAPSGLSAERAQPRPDRKPIQAPSAIRRNLMTEDA
nr:MAG TPA: hypothetical protein [Caudoviricetes sp.]